MENSKKVNRTPFQRFFALFGIVLALSFVFVAPTAHAELCDEADIVGSDCGGGVCCTGVIYACIGE